MTEQPRPEPQTPDPAPASNPAPATVPGTGASAYGPPAYDVPAYAAVPGPTGFTAQVPRPVPVSRTTPWWAVLLAVLAGVLVIGMSGAIGFGAGFALGTHHEAEELRDGHAGFGGSDRLPALPGDGDRDRDRNGSSQG